jgi:glutaminase
MGIGVFSPRVDAHGNSVRGVKVCEEISAAFGLHLFDDRRCNISTLLDDAVNTPTS